MSKKIKSILKLCAIVPAMLFVIYFEDGEITKHALLHWSVHLAACILVCETVHSCKHALTEKEHEHE